MKILFTICGRAGSKGIKNKNLRIFCGNYLVYYTISAIDLYLKRNPEIDADIVANSDSTELLELICSNKMRTVDRIERDESLAGDSIGKIAVINDCLSKMIERKNSTYDMVVDLDITSPLRTVDDLERVIAVQSEKNADVTTTVAGARRNPYFNQVKRTEHGAKKVGYCEIVEMYDTGILDLDHENDFVLMEIIANYLFKENKAFREIHENIES